MAKRKSPIKTRGVRAARVAGGGRGTRAKVAATTTASKDPTLEDRVVALEQRVGKLEHPTTSSEHARAVDSER
jgi:hypothetical protein